MTTPQPLLWKKLEETEWCEVCGDYPCNHSSFNFRNRKSDVQTAVKKSVERLQKIRYCDYNRYAHDCETHPQDCEFSVRWDAIENILRRSG